MCGSPWKWFARIEPPHAEPFPTELANDGRSVSTDERFSSAEHGHLHPLDVELHEGASSPVEGWRKPKLIQRKDRDLLDPTGASGVRGVVDRCVSDRPRLEPQRAPLRARPRAACTTKTA